MDERREEELLMHVAAGTDLLTALAALPHDNDRQEEPQPSPPKTSARGVVWAILAFLAIIVFWWMVK